MSFMIYYRQDLRNAITLQDESDRGDANFFFQYMAIFF